MKFRTRTPADARGRRIGSMEPTYRFIAVGLAGLVASETLHAAKPATAHVEPDLFDYRHNKPVCEYIASGQSMAKPIVGPDGQPIFPQAVRAGDARILARVGERLSISRTATDTDTDES